MTGEESAVILIESLETMGVPYMLAGSFSSNFYGISRSTQDADFVIESRGVTLSGLQQRLGPAFHVDPQMSFETATGTVRTIITVPEAGFKLELFRLSNDAHDQERFRRRRTVFVSQLNHNAVLPSAEDVVVFKLRWAVNAGRSKDREDVRDVIAVQQGLLDWDYIHRWTDEHGTRDCLDEIIRLIPAKFRTNIPLPPDPSQTSEPSAS